MDRSKLNTSHVTGELEIVEDFIFPWGGMSFFFIAMNISPL
jgi:hypothetical protein